jgi:hypothetical protein
MFSNARLGEVFPAFVLLTQIDPAMPKQVLSESARSLSTPIVRNTQRTRCNRKLPLAFLALFDCRRKMERHSMRWRCPTSGVGIFCEGNKR